MQISPNDVEENKLLRDRRNLRETTNQVEQS